MKSLFDNPNSKARILVVEDELITARHIERSLVRMGYEVAAVLSYGEAAVEKVPELKVDLVLMDIRLKGRMDGVEAAELIRSQYNIPIVYLTAYSDEETLVRTRFTTPHGYVLKPFQERELRIIIEIALYKHRVENELDESRQWYETTLKCIGEAVVTVDNEGTVTFLNPIAEQLTGYEDQEAHQMQLQEVLKLQDPETGKMCCNTAERLLQLANRQEGERNWNLITRKGDSIPVAENSAIIRNQNGVQIGVVIVVQDISQRLLYESSLRESERKHRELYLELKEMQEQLIRGERLKAIGELAAGISHNFNNLIGIMQASCDIMGHNKQHPEIFDKEMERLQRTIDRATHVLKRLKHFSFIPEEANPVTNFKSAVDTALSLTMDLSNSQNGEEFQYQVKMDVPGDINVRFSEEQMNEILLNLVINAVEAMPRGGTLSISAEKSEHQGILRVSDTGHGMKEAVRRRILQPFFSTKGRKGSGLGLSISLQLIEQYKGTLEVESEEGKGSTFIISLPLAHSEDLKSH